MNNRTGEAIDYYEVEVKSLEKQIYPNLPRTKMVGYDGLQPGPTFLMRKGQGRPSIVLACPKLTDLRRSSR